MGSILLLPITSTSATPFRFTAEFFFFFLRKKEKKERQYTDEIAGKVTKNSNQSKNLSIQFFYNNKAIRFLLKKIQ